MSGMAPKTVLMGADVWTGFLKAVDARAAGAFGAFGGDSSPGSAGVKVVNISGVLLPSVPEWMIRYGFAVTGYDTIAEEVSRAAADPACRQILLSVDSPGGVVSGVVQAAEAISAAARVKPVCAYVSGLCASAAYWLTSGAGRITASPTAEVGSIGAYKVYYDSSAADQARGLKTVVVRSGEHKGMGQDGITVSQIIAEQENVDALAGQFMAAVAAGRGMGMDQVKTLATGRVWNAVDAAWLGLIDGVETAWNAKGNTPPAASSGTPMKGGFGKAEVGSMKAEGTDGGRSASGNNEEKREMNELEVKALVDAARAEGHVAGVAEGTEAGKALGATAERARCTSLMATFAARDAKFCRSQIEAGASETDALAAWGKKALEAPVVPAAAAVPVGVAALALKPEGSIPDPDAGAKKLSIPERAQALMKATPGMALSAAFDQVQVQDPAGFDAWRLGQE